jgi:hypothetical protein
MSNSPTPGWAMALADGYVASTLKGSPYISHARHRTSQTALCGKKPGVSNARRMTSRVGWLYYTDERAPACEKCLAIVAEREGSK